MYIYRHNYCLISDTIYAKPCIKSWSCFLMDVPITSFYCLGCPPSVPYKFTQSFRCTCIIDKKDVE